ncbi:MAG: DUF2508 family protein [Tissierellia bacterium]|nr:DUF2508 family protein [Tissierellia bacterium]
MKKTRDYYIDKIEKIRRYVEVISKHFQREKSEEEELIENLKKAHEEWEMKEKYFQWATDPDLIEHAIYELKASKIKYIYFLKKAKELENK